LVREGYEHEGPLTICTMETNQSRHGKRYRYSGELQIPKGGKYKYGIRVRPVHPLLKDPFETRLIRWMEF